MNTSRYKVIYALILPMYKFICLNSSNVLISKLMPQDEYLKKMYTTLHKLHKYNIIKAVGLRFDCDA